MESLSSTIDHSAIGAAVALFNAEDYRAALLGFESVWHTERDETLRALILLCNALNQLRLGLLIGPQRNLGTAARLLDHAPARYAGLDIAVLRAYVAALLLVVNSGDALVWEQVPRMQLSDTMTE